MEMVFKLNKANPTQGYDLSLLFKLFIKSSRDFGAGFFFLLHRTEGKHFVINT